MPLNGIYSAFVEAIFPIFIGIFPHFHAKTVRNSRIFVFSLNPANFVGFRANFGVVIRPFSITSLLFAQGNPVMHKDGKTPIKRVRILQSKTTLEKLQKTKFGVRNRKGEVFKWLTYGNLHHVEILRDKASGKFYGEFVTMMEASRRAKGIGMAKQPIVRAEHGESVEFVMALHINDMVSLDVAEKRIYYRIQVLDSPNKRLKLRLHTAATLGNEIETLPDGSSTIPALMKANLVLHQVNSIGKVIG